MLNKEKIRTILRSDWFISALLLIVFFIARGYKFGWDDQHLEIPLLKGLIDPALYPGDYYVDSLKQNFVSFLYPILAHVITIKQIPGAYFILFILSRYFLLYGLYKLWLLISERKLTAVICVIVFILFGRVEELLYRTFSHQELSLAFAVGGLYLFYKERFILAGILMGLGANFHLLYCFFPFAYLGFYLATHVKKHGWGALFKSVFAFLLCALPVIIWAVKKRLGSPQAIPVDIDWITLYKIACPANFIFEGVTFKYIFTNSLGWLFANQKYVLLIPLYILCMAHNRKFRENPKNQALVLVAFILLATSYVFTYIYPSRFVIDLNLIRNVQFLFLILMGYAVILIINLVETEKPAIAFAASVVFGLFIFNDLIAIAACIAMIVLLFVKNISQIKNRFLKTAILLLIFAVTIGCGAAIAWLVSKLSFPLRVTAPVVLAVSAALFIFVRFKKSSKHTLHLRRISIILPLVLLLTYHGQFHYNRMQTELKGGGFWKLQRDWEDVQRFVRSHTPKNAKLMVPYDMEMGGFRIYSERTIICCYRDCGIIGFDYNAAVEWLKRLYDIKPFKVMIDKDVQKAIINAIFKYRVDYILFMHYAEPLVTNKALFEKSYQNDSFSLFKIKTDIPSRIP
ncbi:MAG TPA: hypothetical protein PL155_07950 [Candidatus Omnitrophota bacterium]|nr:hypothetical protein [Candidatus Omnitrophota bacterium]HPD85236.1 hypothetical protein [Candidatus Omnitrophota bacterium]HRZ04263.1 hypothetical protein [Candidatus Omnitrophota bacterium]